MEKPILSARSITKVFDLGEIQVRALRGVDLDIFPGEFVAIMGHSGFGEIHLYEHYRMPRYANFR